MDGDLSEALKMLRAVMRHAHGPGGSHLKTHAKAWGYLSDEDLTLILVRGEHVAELRSPEFGEAFFRPKPLVAHEQMEDLKRHRVTLRTVDDPLRYCFDYLT